VNKLNRKTICGIILAVAVAGTLALMPGASADLTALDKIGTIINMLTNIQNTTNNIQEDLSDKLKLIVGVDAGGIGFGQNEVATITISARDQEGQFVTFNLKEVYVCGTIDAGIGQIRLKEVRVEENDIVIRDADGSDLDNILVDGATATRSCADVLTLLSEGDGRAGAVGLGSDTDIVIAFSFTTTEESSGTIFFVKCIAFVPQEAEFLECRKFP
jgi:hypothetical protein